MCGKISSSDHGNEFVDNLQDFIIEFGKLGSVFSYSIDEAVNVPSIRVILISSVLPL